MIADLLLYDRLVFPVFAGEGELLRWRKNNWGTTVTVHLISDST